MTCGGGRLHFMLKQFKLQYYTSDCFAAVGILNIVTRIGPVLKAYKNEPGSVDLPANSGSFPRSKKVRTARESPTAIAVSSGGLLNFIGKSDARKSIGGD
jgi:hypothetical protein